MATYSTNFGNPSIEATNYENLQAILEKLPDNTGQLISPRDVRDAIFTTWEQEVFNILQAGGENYIGTDNGGTSSNFRYKMFFGKKELQSGNSIMDNTLLTSDTDIFIYNNKSDSNLSIQDTKISFLAGDDFTSFPLAPYLEAFKVVGTSSNRIDFKVSNPSTNGVVNIDSDIIELGQSGWVIDNNGGSLYPVNNGQNIGLTGVGNRLGTIYMSSYVDYLNDLTFKQSGTSSNPIIFDNTGKIIANSLEVTNDLRFQITATAGYFLSNDGLGNAVWSPGRIDTVGVTAGYMSVADGISGVDWIENYSNSNGVTAGYVLTSIGTGDKPEYKDLGKLPTTATAGYVLGSNGSETLWVSNPTSADGNDGAIQFSESSLLKSDESNFFWDNINKRLGIKTNTPNYDLDINGTINAINGTFSLLTSSNIYGITASFDNLQINLPSTNGQILKTDGSGNGSWQNLTDGADRTIQFSNSGNLDGTTNLTWNSDDSYYKNSLYNITDNSISGATYSRNYYRLNQATPTTGSIISSIIGSVGTNTNGNLDNRFAQIDFVASGVNRGQINFRTTTLATAAPTYNTVSIDANGYLGIGTDNPIYNLDVPLGNVRLNGSMTTGVRAMGYCSSLFAIRILGLASDHYVSFEYPFGLTCPVGQFPQLPGTYRLEPIQRVEGRVVHVLNPTDTFKTVDSAIVNIVRNGNTTSSVTVQANSKLTFVYFENLWHVYEDNPVYRYNDTFSIADNTGQTFTHNLGYIPRATVYCQDGNLNPNITLLSSTQIRIFNYNGGGNTAIGGFYLW